MPHPLIFVHQGQVHFFTDRIQEYPYGQAG